MAFGGGLEQTTTYQATPRDLVDFEVRGGIENVLDEKLICRRLLF